MGSYFGLNPNKLVNFMQASCGTNNLFIAESNRLCCPKNRKNFNWNKFF